MKKVIFSIMVLVILAGLLTTTGCKGDKMNITGGWLIITTLEGNEFSDMFTFAGDNRSGDVLYDGQYLGAYSVVGDTISFTLEYYDQDDDYTVEVYTGSIDSDYQMSGNFSYSVEGFQTLYGTWLATR